MTRTTRNQASTTNNPWADVPVSAPRTPHTPRTVSRRVRQQRANAGVFVVATVAVAAGIGLFAFITLGSALESLNGF